MSKSTTYIRIPKKHGEKTIDLANKLGLLDKSLEIQRNEDKLCIPLVREPEDNELETLKSQLAEYQLATGLFLEKQLSHETFKQFLQKKLPPDLLASLPQALDLIGDIAIIEIPSELKTYQNVIGEAILQTHRNIRTVLAKAGAIGGTYRVREYTNIAGEQKTQTVHKEFGCQYHVDVSKVYFSGLDSHMNTNGWHHL